MCYEKSQHTQRLPLFEDKYEIKKMLEDVKLENNEIKNKYFKLKEENRQLKLKLNGGK